MKSLPIIVIVLTAILSLGFTASAQVQECTELELKNEAQLIRTSKTAIFSFYETTVEGLNKYSNGGELEIAIALAWVGNIGQYSLAVECKSATETIDKIQEFVDSYILWLVYQNVTDGIEISPDSLYVTSRVPEMIDIKINNSWEALHDIYDFEDSD